MQDIADRVKVSRSTVSQVLSGKAAGKVSERVQKKVRETARELNYHVNSLAQSLRTGESKVIGVIVTDIASEFFNKLISCIQEEAMKQGYLVLTVNTNEDEHSFMQMVDILVGKKVDGIIAIPTKGGESALRRILDHGVPLVTVDRFYEGIPVDYVGIDNYDSAYRMIKQALEDGYRSISLASLDIDVPSIMERRKAYQDAMEEAGLEREIDVRLIPFQPEDTFDIVDSLEGFAKRDAVFFTSRRVFYQSMSAVAARRLAIPSSQCLLCFDDASPFIPPCNDFRYISQPIREMAKKSFELLLKQIHGKSEPGKYLLPAREVRL